MAQSSNPTPGTPDAGGQNGIKIAIIAGAFGLVGAIITAAATLLSGGSSDSQSVKPISSDTPIDTATHETTGQTPVRASPKFTSRPSQFGWNGENYTFTLIPSNSTRDDYDDVDLDNDNRADLRAFSSKHLAGEGGAFFVGGIDVDSIPQASLCVANAEKRKDSDVEGVSDSAYLCMWASTGQVALLQKISVDSDGSIRFKVWWEN